MKLFLALAGVFVACSVAPDTPALAMLQPPPHTYADEGVNAAGWGNILWAGIAIVAAVMFISLAMIGLRGSRRPNVRE